MLFQKEKKAPFLQCFICREWSYLTKCEFEAELCLPCYVDVLEIRQRRGATAVPNEDAAFREGPDQPEPLATHQNQMEPLATRQIEMFDGAERRQIPE